MYNVRHCRHWSSSDMSQRHWNCLGMCCGFTDTYFYIFMTSLRLLPIHSDVTHSLGSFICPQIFSSGLIRCSEPMNSRALSVTWPSGDASRMTLTSRARHRWQTSAPPRWRRETWAPSVLLPQHSPSTAAASLTGEKSQTGAEYQ